MSTVYRDGVVAKSPLVYGRADEVGAAVNGMEIADESGNDRHGALYYVNASGSFAPLGQASGVETDADSRALLSSSGSFVDNASVTHPIPAVPGNATLKIRVKYHFNFVSSLGTVFPYVGTGSLSLGHSYDGSGDRFAASITLADASTHTLRADNVVPVEGDWYEIAVRRDGNAWSLVVNTAVADLDTLPASPTASGTTLTVGHTSLAAQQTTLEEWAYFDRALTLSELTEDYENALNSLPLYARCVARSVAVLDSTPAPDPQAYPFRHNWSTPFIERLSCPTVVQTVEDGGEERTGSLKPRRTFTAEAFIGTLAERRRFDRFLWTNHKAQVAMPFDPDATRLTAAADAGDIELAVVTAYLDFDADRRALLENADGSVTEVVEIASVAPTVITLKQPLVNAWPSRSRISPAPFAYVEQETKLVSHNRVLTTGGVTARVTVEDSKLAPNRFTPHVAAQTYKGVDVFDPFEWGNNYNEPADLVSTQGGAFLDGGRGVFKFMTGTDAPAGAVSCRLLLKGRAQIAAWLGWWVARAGRLIPVWVPSLDDTLDLVSLSNFTVTVEDADYRNTYNLHHQRRDICLVSTANALNFRRIVDVDLVSGNEVLTVDVNAVLPATSRICFLKLCRLDADDIDLVWHTSGAVEVAFRFRELLNDPAQLD